MNVRRLRGIKRIIIPASAQPAGATGGTGATIVVKAKRRKRRKQRFKFLEKLTRGNARATGSIYAQYLRRHKRSNRRKKDGWIKDLSKNTFNAVRKGRKRFKLSRLF